MKILYDHQIFSIQEYGGIARYFVELIKHINDSSYVDYDIAIPFNVNHILASNSQILKKKTYHIKGQYYGKRKIINLVNQILFRRIYSNDFDIFHPTYYYPYFLNLINKKPFVVTIHDLTHEFYPNLFPPGRGDKISKYKYELITKSDKIITVSNQTKNDIIKLYGVPSEKIEVTYLGRPEDTILGHFNLDTSAVPPDQYILYVGKREGYKNFERFVKAISDTILKRNDLYLLCIGGGGFTKKESTMLELLRIYSKTYQLNVSDKGLAKIYKNAVLFVYPSLYEGFGLPILEAMTYSCPVVLSDIPCFNEVAGDSALYFDPNDEFSIKNTIVKCLDSAPLRKYLVAKGDVRIKEFSWEQTLKKTMDVYKSLL